ncbi:uncharacterized protein LOC126896838 isoform X2 [Daktulosphaira vitifoliae]|uniref:uncharacterized protein LOC126896838 isoform X2 n=1 Tax=Daktulosphaira vitifoliae TaxID=58002 RepID=UPI0021AA3A14|nr:uncharacterized protein LOC126896838 isoform X2 [Daktulosphaira vitifoliae]
MNLFILFTFYLMIIETYQMDCCCGDLHETKFNEVVEDLRICIASIENLPDTYKRYANIEILKGHVQEFRKMYNNEKNNQHNLEKLDNELALSFCVPIVENQDLIKSLSQCVKTFRENL